MTHLSNHYRFNLSYASGATEGSELYALLGFNPNLVNHLEGEAWLNLKGLIRLFDYSLRLFQMNNLGSIKVDHTLMHP